MRLLPTSVPLVLLPLILPAAATEQPSPAPAAPNADAAMGFAPQVDASLRELGAEIAPATAASDAPMPEAPEGQSVVVSDGGLFFDSGNSRLVYLNNVRLNDSRAQLRAANRLYIQLPRQGEQSLKATPTTDTPPAPAATESKPAATTTPAATAPTPAATTTPAPAPAVSAAPAPEPPTATQEPVVPVEVQTYDALVDSVANRMLFSSGPGVPQLSFRQGDNLVNLTAAEGKPARVLADEIGNILMEAPTIDLAWRAEDGSMSELHTTGGRILYHAASHALVMDGPVELIHRNGESRLQCSGPFCLTLQPEEAPARKKTGFMSQFAAMRFSGIAAASATGNVQLSSRLGGEGMAVSGDALYYNGTTGKVEIPGTPCILSYGAGGRNTLQTDGSIVLEENGDIHITGKDSIEGVYERPAQDKAAPPLRGTLSMSAPLSFHASNGTITTRALQAHDEESSLSCTGEVLLTLSPRTAEEQLDLPPREKMGMVNLALAHYGDIAAVKATGQVRARLLDPATPSTPEATLSASQLEANLSTGEILLTGAGESAAIAFRGYSLSGTAAPLAPASVHLKPNGDIEARGTKVTCTIPGDKGITTLSCAERILLAREPRSLSLGSGTRIQSPDGIITTNGPMQAVLAAATKPVKPLSPRFPQLTYDFSGLDSAETFEGATIRTAQGSMQCSQHLSILMLPPDSSEKSTLGGIRSAIATGQVLVAAKDSAGRVMRAAGSRLEVDGRTGEKKLTGSKVVLEDARNRHEATGEGAAVRIDARNNARITGARHSTAATSIRAQVDENDKKNQPQDNKPN